MSHPVDQLVGKMLRIRRKFLDMTQQDLADKVGITFQQVQKYERGVNRISASRLFDIAIALGVPITYFFKNPSEDVEYAPSNDNANTVLADAAEQYDAFSSPETIELLKYFYRCSPDARKQFIAMLKSIASGNPTMD